MIVASVNRLKPYVAPPAWLKDVRGMGFLTEPFRKLKGFDDILDREDIEEDPKDPDYTPMKEHRLKKEEIMKIFNHIYRQNPKDVVDELQVDERGLEPAVNVADRVA
ncbi:MAG: hypothetical protein ACK56F_10995, partial [bacterium]